MCPRPQEKGSRWDSSSLESRNWTTVLSLLHYSVFIYFVFFLCRLAIWQRVHHFYLHLSHIQQVINCLNLSFKYPERESKCFNFCIYLWFDLGTSSELNKIIAIVSQPTSGRDKRKGKVINYRGTLHFLIFSLMCLFCSLSFSIKIYIVDFWTLI